MSIKEKKNYRNITFSIKWPQWTCRDFYPLHQDALEGGLRDGVLGKGRFSFFSVSPLPNWRPTKILEVSDMLNALALHSPSTIGRQHQFRLLCRQYTAWTHRRLELEISLGALIQHLLLQMTRQTPKEQNHSPNEPQWVLGLLSP